MRIAIDTNVLVRFLTWDDEPQALRAAEIIEAAEAVVVSTTVLCEAVWVLRRAYKLPHRAIASTLRDLMETRTTEMDRPAVEAGLAMLERGGDFADGVILFDAECARAGRLVTFDQSLAARADPERVQLLGG
ncbi:MAG TPA: type II toxin-antitoxin system VapC family toxin [Acetobacteraceae bacterium]|nr:type II toxin-antitoxin system VapC family toxin [Acetobacteraceae bacterium]